MKRPFVELANEENVYDYFSRHRPNQRFMKRFHGLTAKLFHPQVNYELGATEKIDSHIAGGGRTVFSLSHATWFDPLVYAAVLHKQPPMRAAIGNILVPGSAAYFNKPVVGPIITTGGAIPVFRKKDVERQSSGAIDLDTELKRKEASETMIKICINGINNGLDVAIFPEGTRNRGARRTIQEVHRGIVDIVNGVDSPDELLVVSMSSYYGEQKAKNVVHPAVGVAAIAIREVASFDLPLVHQQLQAGLDLAIDNY